MEAAVETVLEAVFYDFGSVLSRYWDGNSALGLEFGPDLRVILIRALPNFQTVSITQVRFVMKVSTIGDVCFKVPN